MFSRLWASTAISISTFRGRHGRARERRARFGFGFSVAWRLSHSWPHVHGGGGPPGTRRRDSELRLVAAPLRRRSKRRRENDSTESRAVHRDRCHAEDLRFSAVRRRLGK